LIERKCLTINKRIRIPRNSRVSSFVTFSFNKTSDWLDSLPRAERDKILNDARKHGREVKQKFKDRCLEIERKRFEKQEALTKALSSNLLCGITDNVSSTKSGFGT
jgi:hypothetical protein